MQAHHYAQFLIDNATVIRTADPAATVVSAGLDSTPSTEACPPIESPTNFGNKMFEEVRNDGAWGTHMTAQVKAAFDGFGLHPYAFGSSFEDRLAKFKERVRAGRNVLRAHGDSSPLWLTEMGWSVAGENLPANEPVSSGEQGILLTEAMTWVRNQSAPELENIAYAVWYFYRDANEPGGLRCAPFRVCWQNHAGLLDAAGTARPAWCAYSRLIGTNLCAYIPTGGFNTETFSTVSETRNGTPGTATVIGHVYVTNPGFESEPINGVFVNVNFEKLEGGTWVLKSTAHPTVTNNYYEIRDWGVGVGTWRVRTVLEPQGNYNTSRSGYHEFTITPIPTETFLTVDRELNGQPGWVSVSGNVLHNGSPVTGTVSVRFEKFVNGAWQPQPDQAATRTLSNGHYDINFRSVGGGRWRAYAKFPEQGDYAESESSQHGFEIGSGYRLIGRQSGRCMSLSANNGANGTPIILWDCGGSPSPGDGQVFTLVPMEESGQFYEVKINSTGKCVDVAGANPENGAYLQEWDCLGAGQWNQLWEVIPIEQQWPYIALRARHSGRCADVLGQATGNGARIGQWDCWWGGNQQWQRQWIG